MSRWTPISSKCSLQAPTVSWFSGTIETPGDSGGPESTQSGDPRKQGLLAREAPAAQSLRRLLPGDGATSGSRDSRSVGGVGLGNGEYQGTSSRLHYNRCVS